LQAPAKAQFAPTYSAVSNSKFILARSSYLRSLLTYSAIALVADVLSLALWSAGFLTSLQSALVLLPKGHPATSLTVPSLWKTAILIFAVSFAVTLVVDRFGGRRAFLYLGGGLLALAALSLFASSVYALDILFVPIALAASVSGVVAQAQQLRERDSELTEKLIAASAKFESVRADEAESRLLSGLQLLDTVLSPSEAIVFRRDRDGRLTVSARLRANQTASLETARNSAWRDGVRLCDRAIAAGEIIVDKLESEVAAANIALPLRHEDRTVGAVLIRVTREFDEDDRALLTAVGGQMARSLQLEEAHKTESKRSALAFFSATESEQRLESLYVLNGVMLEQSVGVSALSEIGDGVALGYFDGRIAFANPTLADFAGIEPEQTRKMTFFDLLDRFKTDVFDEPARAVRRVLQTGEAYECELQFADRNATYRLRLSLVLANSQPKQHQTQEEIHGSPQPLCLALVIKDMTLLKEYDQLKSDMISLMSHELRTPLTSINGFAELLTADDTLPAQAKEFVTIIANESQRLSRMINTFLTVTQLQRKDRQEVLKIPLRLDEVVKETIASMQTVAKKRRIRLVEQPSQRLPPVAADKSMITQAVKNLVSNAIKYSPERTTVTVTTSLEAEVVRLSVEDRGYGIPAESRDRVWEKFYRVVREGQEKDEESTGLGLSFVREVVEQHGGTVGLDSEVGRGSKFSFTLPRL
jgi:signal transduction histidine kinase